ncbi:uncharacterized protein C1orf112 homolog isoform X2 [Spea bombifrons]|uniref:uncharacterized protein C1orf112 homolog isoform X2 n=1 Tax=Spea bombifrons TaxID=233779 RepID=UPI00234942E8|nr:uncharacterized protein C1orf112 homolog isoform X2 [Spea bombifrons]
MSQAELLDEMSHWSPDVCRRELPVALPKLITLYQSSHNWTDDIRMFNLLTEMFLPHAGKLFEKFIYEISSQASALSSQNVELKTLLRNVLQNMVHCLKALTICVRHVSSLDETITLENIRSLPAPVLHVLRSAFAHCKDSDAIYGVRLNLVSDLLQAIFKEAVCLQKQLMELLDKTNVNSVISEKDTEDMVSVLHSVLDICTVVAKMDHALHANTWKFIIKQSLKQKALVESQLRHHDIVRGLCDDILLSFQSCLQLAEHMKLSGTQESTDQRLFQKTTKLCRFFANSLVHYTKEFMPFLSQSCNRLHQLYLQVHSMFPPSLYAVSISEAHKNEIACVFLVAFEPLILQLLSFSPFVESVLNEILELPPEHVFPQCLLLINIMDKLPSLSEDILMLWYTGSRLPEESNRMSILKAVFQTFTLCSPELSMPLVLQEVSQKQETVTFYQYVCVHLCAFIISLPPVLFSELECSLLDGVLCCSMMTSLLAMDVWCFLARYGTAELCAHHVHIVACLVKSCTSDCYQLSHLAVLLRRLLFLMAPDHQMEFIKMFPPKEAENFLVWQHLSLAALPNALGAQVKNDLLSAGISQCLSWFNGRCMLKDLPQLKCALSALLTACSSSLEPLDKEQQFAVTGVIGQLMSLLNVEQILCQHDLQQTLCLVLALSTFTVQIMETTLLIQVVSLLSSLSQENPPAHVQLATIEFLGSLGKICIHQEAQTAVLPKISSLFSLLLEDKSWVIKQHALEAFTHFAKETSHEEVVPQSLTSEETKNEVISFLNKTTTKSETEDIRVQRVKEEKVVLDAFFSNATSKLMEELSLESSAKRSRRSESDVHELEVHIQAAHNALTNVQFLLQRTPSPDWLPEKLQNILTLLTSVQETCKPR